MLAGTVGENVALAAFVAEPWRKKTAAGKLIQAMAPHVDGKGGGSADSARGGGRNAAGIAAALAAAQTMISN